MRALWLLALTACRLGFDPSGGMTGDDTPMVSIAVTKTGSGGGTIRVKRDGGEVPCTSTCEVPLGTTVSFVAEADVGAWFRGWTAGCNTGRRTCTTVANGPLAVTGDFTPEPNRIFISSTPHDGLLLPTAGDAFCTQLAIDAELTGTYKAVLTTPGASWTSRFVGARGFIRVDGQPVADSLDAIDDRIMAAITIDERGQRVAGPTDFWVIHTGVNGNRCLDWTSNATTDLGTVTGAERGSNYQSGGGNTGCNTEARVICAGADRDVPVMPVPDGGRQGFTTIGLWSASSGLAAADALCASEAENAGLTGTFKALIQMPGASALSRFDLEGPPWVRVDGTPFLPTAAAWATAANTDASFHVAADGTYFFFNLIAGATDLSTPGTAQTTCDGWSNATGTSGRPFYTWDTAIRPLAIASYCSSNARLICLEE